MRQLVNSLDRESARGFLVRVFLLAVLSVAVWLPASAQNESARRASTQVTSVQHYVTSDRIRIVVQLNGIVKYLEGTANDPYRLFFDLQGTRPAAALVSKTIVRDPVMQRIRVGQYQPGVMRVVLDLNERTPYLTSVLTNPPRLMIEVLRTATVGQTHDTSAPSLSAPSRVQAPRQVPYSATRAANAAPQSSPPALPPQQMPPAAPEVTYRDGQLTIVASNCTLAGILHAVAVHTGAIVDAPDSLTDERVAARVGPGPPRSVLTDLLSGSDFDYILIGDDQDPNAVRRIILTAETSLQSAPAVAQAVPQGEVEEEVHVVDQPEPPIAQQPAEQIGTGAQGTGHQWHLQNGFQSRA
jgi:hypothetical protein